MIELWEKGPKYVMFTTEQKWLVSGSYRIVSERRGRVSCLFCPEWTAAKEDKERWRVKGDGRRCISSVWGSCGGNFWLAPIRRIEIFATLLATFASLLHPRSFTSKTLFPPILSVSHRFSCKNRELQVWLMSCENPEDQFLMKLAWKYYIIFKLIS